MNIRRIKGLLAVATVVVGGSVVLSGQVDAASKTTTIKAALASNYRLLAVASSGKAYLARSTGGKVSLAGIPKSDTNGMTLSVLNSDGAYVGPVMLGYTDAKNKKTTAAKATKGLTNLKTATGSTVSLGSIKVSSDQTFASLAKAAPSSAVLSRSVAVSGGRPPARANLGKGTGVSGAGVRKFADPTENKAGADADNDGLPSFVDVDDDNDGKLDLVDDKFFNTSQKDDGSQLGDALIGTGLICGGNCVNLNAFNVTSPSANPAVATALNTMINTFQGVFFIYNTEATKRNFTLPATMSTIGSFNVDCTGIKWCSGSAAQAATISPDYPTATQQASNALPDTDYTKLCGSKVIAPTNTVVNGQVQKSKPATWPGAFTWDDASSMMTEWLFSSCDPDGDGFSNIIPSVATLQSGEAWTNEIKPRMSGSDGLKVGDAIKYTITKTNKTVVHSSTQVISAVMQTSPNVRSWGSTTLDYAANANPTTADMRSPSSDTVTFTFWRPQRMPIGTSESTWMDVGGLNYSFTGPAGGCTITSAVTSTGTALTVQSGSKGSYFTDTASDATPNPANFITVTANVATCKGATGQWSVSAADRAMNSTHFKWTPNQVGTPGTPQPGQPAPQGPPNPQGTPGQPAPQGPPNP